MNNKVCYIRNKLNGKTRVSPAGVNPVIFQTSPVTTLELVDSNNKVINDNIGYYNPDPASGLVQVNGLNVQRILGSRNFIKFFAVPANQSAVESTLNTILRRDAEESFIQAVVVSTR